jgi:hypothetical protein
MKRCRLRIGGFGWPILLLFGSSIRTCPRGGIVVAVPFTVTEYKDFVRANGAAPLGERLPGLSSADLETLSVTVPGSWAIADGKPSAGELMGLLGILPASLIPSSRRQASKMTVTQYRALACAYRGGAIRPRARNLGSLLRGSSWRRLCLWAALSYDPVDPLYAARIAQGLCWPGYDDWIFPILNEPLLEDFMSHPEILGNPVPLPSDPALAGTMPGRRANLAELLLARLYHVWSLSFLPEQKNRLPLAAILLRHPEAWSVRVRWPFGYVPAQVFRPEDWNGVLQWGRRTLPFPMALALAANNRFPQALDKPAREALIHAGLKGFATSGLNPGILLDRIEKHMKYLLGPIGLSGFSIEGLREMAHYIEMSRAVQPGADLSAPVL